MSQAEQPDAAAAAAAAPADNNLDAELEQFALSLKKKKKKRDKKPVASSSAESPSSEADAASAAVSSSAGATAAAADGDSDYTYTQLLNRIFDQLKERNPNYLERQRHKMPTPHMVRVSSKKVMWANFQAVCTVLRRDLAHVQSFILAELAAEGNLDGNQRLVLKGRFIPRQIEVLIMKYIMEYVTCRMCKSPGTALERDNVTRLYFLQCNDCKSRRSVTPIKAGFHATSRADRRAAKQAKQK